MERIQSIFKNKRRILISVISLFLVFCLIPTQVLAGENIAEFILHHRSFKRAKEF